MPFVVPDLETADVQLKGLPGKVHRDPFHQHLVLREDRVAALARFAVASTTPNLFDAIARQAPVLELASDEKTEGLLVHGGLPGSNRPRSQTHRGLDARRRQPERPGCRRADPSTGAGRCASRADYW